jgi:hypothetical protein
VSANEGAASTPIEDGLIPQHSATKSIHRHTARKWQRWLAAVLESPKTTRELEKAPVFDHVAHSTASEVRKMGIEVVTEMVTIRGYAGEPARVARYSIAEASRVRATRLLAVRS